MAGDNMPGGVGKTFDLAKGIQHGSDVDDGDEWTVGADFFVIMAGIRGKDDVATLRVHAHDLKAGCMNRGKVQRQPWSKIHITVVQFKSALEVEPHYSDNILLFEAVTEVWVAHIAPGGEG